MTDSCCPSLGHLRKNSRSPDRRPVRLTHLRRILFFLALAGAVCAQTPRIGRIEFYGLRKVPEAKVRKALGIAEGDALPRSKPAVEDRLTQVPGIVRAHLEATCCDEG